MKNEVVGVFWFDHSLLQQNAMRDALEAILGGRMSDWS